MGTEDRQQRHSKVGRAQLWQDESGPGDRTSGQCLGVGLPGAKGIWRGLGTDFGA